MLLAIKNPPANADVRDTGLIPGSRRSPERGNGNPLQYSCLENPVDRGAWWATVCGVTELDTTQATFSKLSGLAQQQLFMLLTKAYLGRALLTLFALFWTVSVSLTLCSRWLCDMAGTVELAVGYKISQGLFSSKVRPFFGLLGIPYATVAGFQEQVFSENEEMHCIFMT